MNRSDGPGLYIHVPFCRSKCPYCDFYSIPSEAKVPAWLEALEREALFYAGAFPEFDSLYLGGGTPTLLEGRDLSRLMDSLHRTFTFRSDAECTVEANPDDITREKLDLLLDLGFNRISVGVQAFSDEELRFLQRRHSARRTLLALDTIRSSGFRNLGIDLIYGFEGHTKKRWRTTLEHALSYDPEHLSCYQMTLEPGTPFGKLQAKGAMELPSEEVQRELFLFTSRTLEGRGYFHYEISNFAQSPGRVSRHNSKYWNHTPYLGLGPSAHSFQEGRRWWNLPSVERYCQSLAAGHLPVEGSETLSPEQIDLETLYLGFRTKAGLDLDRLRRIEGADPVLRDLQRSRLLEVHQGRAIPTRNGFLVADSLPLLFGER